MDKKWTLGIFTSVFVIAGLVGFRDRLIEVWASPIKISKVEEVLVKQQETTEQLANIITDQKEQIQKQEADLDKTKEIQALQISSMKEQLALISDLKKKK